MMNSKHWLIRTKLTFVILSTTFLSIALVFLALFAFEYFNYERALVTDLSSKARLLGGNMDASLAFRDSADASRMLQSLATQEQIIAAAVYDSVGRLFAAYERHGERADLPAHPLPKSSRTEGDMMVFSEPISDRGGLRCTIHFVVDLTQRNVQLFSYVKIAAAVLFGSLFIAFFISSALQKSVSGPILSLAGTAQRFTKLGDYSLRAVKVSNDETGILVDSINGMLVQLEERDRTLRRTNEAMAKEIAERSRAEERFRSVVESAPNAMVMANREGVIVLVNSETEKLFGYDRAEIIGRPVEVLVPERFRGKHLNYRTGFMADPRTRGMGVGRDLCGRRKDGSEFPLEIGLNPIDMAGETMVLSAIIDTTERKQAERELQRAHDELERRVRERTAELVETNEELQLMQTISHAMGEVRSLDEALDAVLRNVCQSTGFVLAQAWVYKSEKRCLECSDAWYSSIEGLGAFQALSSRITLPVGETAPASTAVMQRTQWMKGFGDAPGVGERERIVGEAGIAPGLAVPIMVDGLLFAVLELFSQKQTGEGDRIVNIISAIAAQLGIVLHRKQAEEMLRTSEMELEEAQQVANTGSVKWEIATNSFTCSDEFYRIYGLRPDEALTFEAYMALVHPDDRETVRRHALGALGANTPFAFHHRIIRPDGNERVINARGKVVFDDKGKPVRMIGTGQDITELKHAKRILRESEERYRTLVEGVNDYAIYMLDAQGNILSWNSGATRIKGYAADEVIGEHYSMLFPDGEGRREKCEEFLRLAASAGPLEQEGWRVHKDGHRFWAHSLVTPLRDEEEGELIGFTNVTMDITERKKAEEELRKRDILLSTAQQMAQLGSWEWDMLTSKVTWSDELAQIYGIGERGTEWTLDRFLEHIYRDRPETLALMRRSLDALVPFEFEDRFIHPESGLRILHHEVKILVDDHKRATKVVGICLDVTDRRRAEQKFRDLLESAPDAMVIVDPSGVIVLVNAQTERLFGYSREELFGRHVSLLLPDRLRHLHAYFIAPHPLPTSEHGELYGLRKDRSEFPIEVNLSPLETEGGTLISNAIRDITEQRQLRARLIEIERKRSSDLRRYALSVQRAQEEERRRIARELHDDLCQRLSGMKMNLEVIADEFREADGALYHKLMTFNRNCEDMIAEVRRMSVNLRPSVLDDFGLISALGILVRDFEKLHKKSISLVVDNKSTRLQLEPHVEIALYRIAQEALMNVAKHAQASRITVAVHKNAESVAMRIADDGSGFATAQAGARKNDHAGLGLISMRERTELAGGAFSLESSPGKGTIVTVTIPLNQGVFHEENPSSDRR